MSIEDKDMSEIIESDFDEADKNNWIVWVFTILCIAIGASVLIKFIPTIIASDDAVIAEPVEDVVEFPVYYVENMDGLRLDDTDFD
ncbi:MAG: hypothetical protein IJR29_13190, partial [Butyrivibrio sp.]|nr:hypothetical protein [Butyrivibrio sp.]